LILRKIIKIVATRCHILKLKCTKFDFGWGTKGQERGEGRGPTSKARGREGGKGRGAGKEEGRVSPTKPKNQTSPMRPSRVLKSVSLNT